MLTALAVFGPIYPATSAEKMPSKDSFPYQEFTGSMECGERTFSRIDVDTEESKDWPFFGGTFWYYLDKGPKQNNPFLAGIYSLDDSKDRFYVDYNRDGKADQVLTNLQISAMFGEDAPICVLLKSVN